MGAAYEKVAEKTLFNGEKIFEYKLKNGFRVLMIPRHQAEVLTYQVWFDVGSLHEKLDPKLKKTGLAHLFEHMMFRGSEKYPDGKFDEMTSRLGGDHQNATTHYYRTNYFESIPSRNLNALMELEADRMENLRLSTEPFEKEKGAVVGEFRLMQDNPTSVAFEEIMKLAYEVSPYKFSVIGTEAEIKGFSLDEAKYFYKTFYSPNNALLIVVGDTTEEKLMKAVVKYYGDMKPQKLPSETIPTEPVQKKERTFTRTHPQASSEIVLMAYHVPDINNPDTIPLSLLASHLSLGTEARLRKELVDTGIAVRVSASSNNKPDLFQFFVQLAEGKSAAAAIKVIDKEVALVQKKLISKQSFERALNQELLNLYSGIADNHSLGEFLGEYAMIAGNYMKGFEVLEGYKKLTPADLQRVAKECLRKENRSIVIIKPAKKGKS